MQEPDLQSRFDDFFRAAEAFIREPNVMTGLELDEKAGRTRQYCYSHLRDEALGRNMEAILKQVRQQDAEAVRVTTDNIAEQVAGHGFSVNRPG